MRGGRKAAGLISELKMAELPKENLRASSAFSLRRGRHESYFVCGSVRGVPWHILHEKTDITFYGLLFAMLLRGF
jgi:hypothetical protein